MQPARAASASPLASDAAAANSTAAPLCIALLGYRSNPYSGGQGIYLRYLSKALTVLGHRVDVVSGEPYPELDDSVQLIKLPGLNLYEHPSPLTALRPKHLRHWSDVAEWASKASGGFAEPYAYGRRIDRWMREHGHRYDIVHDNQSLAPGLLQIARRGMPLAVTIHHSITMDRDIALGNEPSWRGRLLIRRWHAFLAMQTRVARQLRHIVTVSESSKRDIAEAFRIDPSRIEVVYNGIDIEVFRPRPETQREPFTLITTASADQPLKGTHDLMPAFATLRESFPELKLLMIGRPKPGGATEALIESLGLSPHIEFYSGLSAEQIVDLYARATLAVVPSVYEGFGLPAGEAMACEVPVVSTNGGALPEVVGDAGVIVPVSNPNALAAAIDGLLRDPERRAALGLAGRQRIESRFSWAIAADAMTAAYRRIIAG